MPRQRWSGKSAAFLMESALTSHGSSKSNKKPSDGRGISDYKCSCQQRLFFVISWNSNINAGGLWLVCDVVVNVGLVLWCLAPLSTLFQLYRGGQFYWWKNPEYLEKTTGETRNMRVICLWNEFILHNTTSYTTSLKYLNKIFKFSINMIYIKCQLSGCT